ncbi:MAG: hypothetical protein IRZ28_22415 [Steroidobacteraceae bacterium]|nr:hypothetical protein [Steroidobacteraceae bacterium]
MNRLGTAVRRALSFEDIEVPLEYPGPSDIDALYGDPAFSHRAAVGIAKSRTMRIRPQFKRWSLTVPGLLLTNVLDFDALVDIARLAGLIEGLGDFRSGGFGRFDAKVVDVS